MARTIYIFQSDDEVRFALDQPSHFDFYSASSLKQQSSDRRSHPHGHNTILIPSQPVFVLLSVEATNIICIEFDLTHPGSNLRSTALHAST